MTRSRSATALLSAALVLPFAAFAPPAAAAPGDANPPAPRSVTDFCAPMPQSFDPFTDIAGNTHETAIRCAAYAEIARGGPLSLPPDRYGPALEVRRDQMASFIARLMDTADELDTGDAIRSLPAYDGTPAFSDVEQSNVHFEAINRLEQAGIVRGGPRDLPESQYGPSLPTDRDQMASFINRAIGYLTGSELTTDDDYFVDDEVSVHEPNINGVASGAIAVGATEDVYQPGRDVPRDQMASFLMRTLALLHERGLIADAGSLTAAVVVYDQQGEAVQAGTNITGTIYGVDNATSIAVSGDCVTDGELTDADTSAEGFRFDVTTDPDAADGACQVTFTTTFEDGSTDTDTVTVMIQRPAEIAAVDADGRAVVLDGQTGEVLRVLIDGINVQDPADNAIAVTPDRSTAYVVRPGATGTQDSTIVRVPMAGGAAEEVTQGNAPAVSPDGAVLAFVRFVDIGQATPQPQIIIRNLSTGQERAIAPGPEQDFYGIWELSWVGDTGRIAFTAGEIGTGVYVVDSAAASLDEADRLGPDNTDASWDDVTSLGDNTLAVVEQCCGQPNEDPQTWHIISVDATTGEVLGDAVFGGDRTEAVMVDAREDADDLIAVRSDADFTDGGPLLRWNGTGTGVSTLTDGIIVAAW